MTPRYARYSGFKISLYHRVLQWSIVQPQQNKFYSKYSRELIENGTALHTVELVI